MKSLVWCAAIAGSVGWFVACEQSAVAGDPARTAEKVSVLADDSSAAEKREIRVPAVVESYAQAHLMAKIDAHVAKVHVDLGDEVTAGQLLVELAAPELKAQVVQREQQVGQAGSRVLVRRAELEAAKATLAEQEAIVELRHRQHKRIQGLVDSNAINDEMLDESAYKLASAKAALLSRHSAIDVAAANVEAAVQLVEVAKAERDYAVAFAQYLEIRAPFAGVIILRNVDPGELVRPANQSNDARPLIKLASDDRVRIVAHLTRDQATELDNGDLATYRDEDGKRDPVPGSITRHAKAFDQKTRMMRVEMQVDNPRIDGSGRRRLRPGEYGILQITLASGEIAAAVPGTLRDSSAESLASKARGPQEE